MKHQYLLARIVAAAAATWLISTTPLQAETGEGPTPKKAEDVRSTTDTRTESNSATRTPAAPPKASKSKGIRTLDEITIEGEIAVPQVLFIMARDRQRYQDHLYRNYLKSSLEIGRETAFPAQLACRLRP